MYLLGGAYKLDVNTKPFGQPPSTGHLLKISRAREISDRKDDQRV